MVTKSIVENMHARIATQLSDARRHSESPRIIAMLEILEELTNLNPAPVPAPACLHKTIEQGVCQDCGGEIPSLMTAEPAAQLPPEHCPHANISPFGVCRDCGVCLHEFRDNVGTCKQCGETVPVEAPGAEPPAAE